MLPPPVPTSSMSIIGIWIGRPSAYPPIIAVFAISALPWTTTPAFAVVPPMSNAIARSRPSAAQRRCVPITPAAGPDSSIRMHSLRACAASNSPPVDCTTRNRPGNVSVWRKASTSLRYESTRGPT